MLNQLVLVGRLTHDPETKILEDGRKVAEFNLAVQRSFKNQEGNYDTDFIKISAWEGLANAIESYCKKGNMVAIKARVQSRKSEIAEVKLTTLEVIAERISYLSAKQEEKSSEE